MSPFLTFWRALNTQCQADGYPEPTFGIAKRAWERALSDAKVEAMRAAWKAAA